jgi:hypothetical protein
MIGASKKRLHEPLIEILVDQARQGLGLLSQDRLDDGWKELQSPLFARKYPLRLAFARPAARRPWLAGFAAVSAAVALAVVAYQALTARPEPPLQYVVEGVVARSGDAVNSLPGGTSRLLFSDDSRVDLDPSTNVTVDGLGAHGARVGLVNGAVDVYVRHRRNTEWVFAAGPFRVQVKGTAFRLGFAADRGRLTLQMKSGQVEVFAPSGRTIAVGAGESLELYAEPANREVATLPSARMLVQPPSPENRAEALPASRAGGAAEPSRRRTVLRAGERASEHVVASDAIAWTRLLAQGNFSGVVDDAERRGIVSAIAQATVADLSALADSARYTKRYDLAREVLLAIRARYAGTDHARDASFFLGRLAETSPGRPEAALTWYDTYLHDAPRGLYASEALGREMTLLAPDSPEHARKVARRYLERFPRGTQSELARSLLDSDPE